MPLRFEHHAQPEPGRMRIGFKIFAGKMEVGHIWRDDKFGDKDVRWDWTINQVSMSTLRSIAGGSAHSADDAKRDADEAGRRLCLEPVGVGRRSQGDITSFSEYAPEPDPVTKKKDVVWFAKNDNRPPMAFAGIWRPWIGTRGTKKNPIEGEHLLYSFLTTEPNEVVGPIHPKAMPVILADPQAWDIWLNGSIEEALALQQPAPSDMIQIVARGTNKED